MQVTLADRPPDPRRPERAQRPDRQGQESLADAPALARLSATEAGVIPLAASPSREIAFSLVDPLTSKSSSMSPSRTSREIAAARPSEPYSRFHSPCDGIRSARLNLLDAFSQAMVAVSSTSASSS